MCKQDTFWVIREPVSRGVTHLWDWHFLYRQSTLLLGDKHCSFHCLSTTRTLKNRGRELYPKKETEPDSFCYVCGKDLWLTQYLKAGLPTPSGQGSHGRDVGARYSHKPPWAPVPTQVGSSYSGQQLTQCKQRLCNSRSWRPSPESATVSQSVSLERNMSE